MDGCCSEVVILTFLTYLTVFCKFYSIFSELCYISTERSRVQILTANSIFHAPFIWIKTMKAKIGWQLTWHCCICCNPAKRDFENGWLIKSSFIRMKWKLVSWPGPKSNNNKKKLAQVSQLAQILSQRYLTRLKLAEILYQCYWSC
jgi:hypothetical protein